MSERFHFILVDNGRHPLRRDADVRVCLMGKVARRMGFEAEHAPRTQERPQRPQETAPR